MIGVVANLIVLDGASASPIDRTVLPIPAPPFAGVAQPSLAASTPSWADPVTAPEGAPNILLVMTDDVGFGAASTFGGPIPTPNLDRLAASGARYNNFHTTAMCSPTRASLLTGRNHHGVGTGALVDVAMGFPGYDGELPASSASIARVLVENGYSTAFIGKDHNVPNNESGPTGPFTRWPTGLGFQEFYGFIGAETDQWRPTLYHGTDRVSLAGRSPDLILDQDLTDHAIQWFHQQWASSPDKPFFLYYAPGSTHSPHQAPPEWIARFKGRFDSGWDAMRAETVQRQIGLGLVPPGTKVTPRPAQLPAWESLDRDHKRLYARYMEVYAAMLAYQDFQFGRLLEELQRAGKLDNTLIVFIEGDNGATAEGGPEGSFNELMKLTAQPDKSFAEQLGDVDKMGGPETYDVYPAGWAWALNAPFPMFKQIASHLGGISNGLVMAWPGHITQPQAIRTQFQHVTDIMPTLLDVAGVPAPRMVLGTAQHALDGVSMKYTFASPDLPGRHETQYFELFANRGIYHDGWLASTNPERMPWQQKAALSADQFTWSLYNLRTDFAQATDLSAREPAKLAEMQRLFDSEARRNNVYPLRASVDPVQTARMLRPQTPRSSYIFWGGGVSLPWAEQPRLGGRFTIDCDLVLPKDANGALVATGSKLGGWSFYLHDGRPIVSHSASSAASDTSVIEAHEKLSAGAATLRFRFVADGPAPNAGGTITILSGDRRIGQGRIPRVGLYMAGFGETFDIGNDGGRPAADYGPSPRFNGEIRRIDLELQK
jgi:arylsulfatase